MDDGQTDHYGHYGWELGAMERWQIEGTADGAFENS
jgi:hypothetical protein